MKLLIVFFLPFIFSFSFSPMSQSIELGEKQKSAQFIITNDNETSLAIELTVKERMMGPDGKETLPDTKDLTIFPPQLIIPSKERRTIRVSWNGNNQIAVEKSYRVIAEQLPLKIGQESKNKSGIQMLMRYMAALYVSPENIKADLNISFYQLKNNKLEITVNNDGSKHQVLMDPILTIEGKNKKIVLKDKELEGLAGENVLAKSKRTFILKSMNQLPENPKFKIKVND